MDGGEDKIVVTPQLVHDIFDEYPVVAKAYDENVPSKVPSSQLPALFSLSHPIPQLSEAEFWQRYFQSKLFHSHRASIRSTATQHVVRDDAIFDKYLERPDDGELSLFFFHRGSCRHHIPLELEPRKLRDDEVDMFIDLDATRVDHEEVRNLIFHDPFHTCANY